MGRVPYNEGVFEIHRMEEISNSFRKATYYGITAFVLLAVSLFVDHAVVNVGSLIVGILFCKSLCDGMSNSAFRGFTRRMTAGTCTGRCML